MLKEFKEFVFKGNMLDMAIGIIMGGAFGLAVKSLVDNVLMPLAGYFTGGVDFSNKFVLLGSEGKFATLAAAEKALEGGEAFTLIKYGVFINDVINLLIIGFSMFIMVKYVVNSMKKKEEEAPAEPSAEVKLLTEIRDSLAK
ncbi:MAG: large conductance mechanosensitive channel protein MscL [Verrucomicrobiales bacterium]|nr:large conductance mechanosensitive channel protein MscL [Verrucomicrobiae bacterium]